MSRRPHQAHGTPVGATRGRTRPPRSPRRPPVVPPGASPRPTQVSASDESAPGRLELRRAWARYSAEWTRASSAGRRLADLAALANDFRESESIERDAWIAWSRSGLLGMSVRGDVIEHSSVSEELDHLQASSQFRTSSVLGAQRIPKLRIFPKGASIGRRVSRGTSPTWRVMGGVFVGRFD